MATFEALLETGISLRSITVVAFVFGVVSYALSWYRLSHIPGPFFSSLSDLWLLTAQLRGNVYKDLNNLTIKHGSLVRIGPNSVLTTDINVLQRMSATKSPYVKGPWYGTFRFLKGIDHSFSTLDEAKHIAMRTKTGPAYSASNVVEQCIDRQLTRFINLIERKFLSEDLRQSYQPIDMAFISHLYSMDVIGDITFGKPFGFLDEGTDIYDYIAWNESFFPIMTAASTLPFLSKAVRTWPLSSFLPKASDSVGLGRFIRDAQAAVEEQLKSGTELRRDMMGLFLRHGITKDEAISEALLSVVAGTDSVAVAIRMTLLYVLSAPPVYIRLLAEIDNAYASGGISKPIILDAEAKRLPYLQAVIREGIRVFPPVPALFNKTVPAGGDFVAGYHLPSGTQVGANGYGILRSKECWGEDADCFRPERWLQADGKQLEEMNNRLEVTFGYGRYKCLGRSVAFMEMNKTLVELLRRFDFRVVNPPQPLKMFSASFWMMKDLWMVVDARKAG